MSLLIQTNNHYSYNPFNRQNKPLKFKRLTLRITCMIVSIFMLSSLAGCGYRQLGSAPSDQPFSRLYLAADTGLLQKKVAQRLTDSNIELDAEPFGSITLGLRDEAIGQAIAAVDLAGDVIEYRRYHHISMTVIAADGSVLLPEQRLIAERRYRFDETRLLASQAEADRIGRALADELTERVILRLYAIDKPSLLEPLEQPPNNAATEDNNTDAD